MTVNGSNMQCLVWEMINRPGFPQGLILNESDQWGYPSMLIPVYTQIWITELHHIQRAHSSRAL